MKELLKDLTPKPLEKPGGLQCFTGNHHSFLNFLESQRPKVAKKCEK